MPTLRLDRWCPRFRFQYQRPASKNQVSFLIPFSVSCWSHLLNPQFLSASARRWLFPLKLNEMPPQAPNPISTCQVTPTMRSTPLRYHQPKVYRKFWFDQYLDMHDYHKLKNQSNHPLYGLIRRVTLIMVQLQPLHHQLVRLLDRRSQLRSPLPHWVWYPEPPQNRQVKTRLQPRNQQSPRSQRKRKPRILEMSQVEM